jgi:uncharacterized circularly permuted ATP-grasp superfamily protein/uncharacterized alpha-E superfamily protein
MHTIDPAQFSSAKAYKTGEFATLAQAQAAAFALPAGHGHFDELRGMAFDAGQASGEAALSPLWAGFFESLGLDGIAQLDQRMAQLNQQIAHNGITYNVYGQADSVANPQPSQLPTSAQGQQRPWALDLFPFLLSGQEWQGIEAGVLQRARVLEGIMADVYGPQQLLKKALLPAALTQGHSGYLRAMHGARPAGGRFLHIAAFDLARGPSGQWWVVSQRTQAPSGLGYLLENRAITSRLFNPAFKSGQVQTLESTYQTLLHTMRQQSPAGEQAHIALLTPGPYSETYFEHAYLARHLGLSLVEGTDLIVRQQKLFLKTLHGLEPIHGLLKRLDDAFLDPLELRSDSSLGVPGLLQCIRAGNVLMANAPGSAFLESPAILGFMPGIAQALLGEQLSLPALPTWWCGERAALDSALPHLTSAVVKPSYPSDGQQLYFEAMLGKYMDGDQRDALAGRMLRDGNAYTVQSYLPMSQMPTWEAGNISLKSAMLRVFAVSDGAQGWRVLPGGLMRIASGRQGIASMQSGGSSADVWVSGLASSAFASTPAFDSMASPAMPAPPAMQLQPSAKRVVTSRCAENLFWLGRYSERAECGLHAAQHILSRTGEGLQDWLSALAVQNSLVLPSVPSLAQSPRVFERSLLAALGDAQTGYSLGFNLLALKNAAFTVRERLSQEQWDLIARTQQHFAAQSQQHMSSSQTTNPTQPVLSLLTSTNVALAAITGAQTDRMARDDGWRLLSIGRLIERLQFLAAALLAGFAHGALSFNAFDQTQPKHQAGYQAMLALFDSSTTFRAHYPGRDDMAALLESLVLDRDNPRSLAWVAKTLRGRLAKLQGDAPQEDCALSRLVPDARLWRLADLLACNTQSQPEALLAILSSCTAAATQVAQAVGAQYFTHSQSFEISVGT